LLKALLGITYADSGSINATVSRTHGKVLYTQPWPELALKRRLASVISAEAYICNGNIFDNVSWQTMVDKVESDMETLQSALNFAGLGNVCPHQSLNDHVRTNTN
jgi:hypothetical protein